MPQRKKNNSRWAGWILIILFLALLILFSLGKSGLVNQVRVKLRKHQVVIEKEEILSEIDTLEAEEAALHDPETIEKIARENYGMAKENEKVYRIESKENKDVE